MKKKSKIVISSVLFAITNLTLITSIGAESFNTAISNRKFNINGQNVNVNSLNVNGQNYIKTSEVAELLDIEVQFDEETNTILLDESKPFSYTDIPKEDIISNNNYTTNINIPKLDPNEYVIFDLCEINMNDNIILDIESNGNGILSVGFVEDKEVLSPTIIEHRDYSTKGKIEYKLENTWVEGNYYLVVKNDSNDVIENINGKIIIEKQANRMIEKTSSYSSESYISEKTIQESYDNTENKVIQIDIPELASKEYV